MEYKYKEFFEYLELKESLGDAPEQEVLDGIVKGIDKAIRKSFNNSKKKYTFIEIGDRIFEIGKIRFSTSGNVESTYSGKSLIHEANNNVPSVKFYLSKDIFPNGNLNHTNKEIATIIASYLAKIDKTIDVNNQPDVKLSTDNKYPSFLVCSINIPSSSKLLQDGKSGKMINPMYSSSIGAVVAKSLSNSSSSNKETFNKWEGTVETFMNLNLKEVEDKDQESMTKVKNKLTNAYYFIKDAISPLERKKISKTLVAKGINNSKNSNELVANTINAGISRLATSITGGNQSTPGYAKVEIVSIDIEDSEGNKIDKDNINEDTIRNNITIKTKIQRIR